jgi:acetoin utilization deacetylase AcuC-like enzyme
MKTTIYTHPSFLGHDTGAAHPERIDRLTALHDLLGRAPLTSLPRGNVPAATMDQILLAHTWDYIQSVERAIPAEGHTDLEGEVVLSPGTWDAALHAAGAVCAAADDIATGKTTRAFCAVRPPGHHALPARAMGFCLFNNVFIGARHAQTKHGIGNIAIVDFDVHHGNGTDAMTRAHDESILFISSHQHPLWPMSGLPEDNEDSVQNWTLPPGAGSDEFQTLYEKKVFPAVAAFGPELIFISAGFDAHTDDPLGGLNLTPADYAWVTERLARLSDQSAGGRIVSVLEGGYDLSGLSESVRAHLTALMAE